MTSNTFFLEDFNVFVLINFYCIVFSQSLVDYDDKPCLTFASDDEDEMENDIFSGKKYIGTLFGSLLCHQLKSTWILIYVSNSKSFLQFLKNNINK
jgi:hypothetical protein